MEKESETESDYQQMINNFRCIEVPYPAMKLIAYLMTRPGEHTTEEIEKCTGLSTADVVLRLREIEYQGLITRNFKDDSKTDMVYALKGQPTEAMSLLINPIRNKITEMQKSIEELAELAEAQSKK